MRKRNWKIRLLSWVLALLAALPLFTVQPLAEDGMSKQEMHKAFFEIHGVAILSGAPFYSVEQCLSKVEQQDAAFTKYSELYGIPKAFAQSSALRELLYYNLLDWGVDIFVSVYFTLCNFAETLGLPDAVPQLTTLFGSATESSTGYGQVEGFRAISVHNWALENGILEGTPYDANNRKEREAVWRKLRDDQDFNIQMVTLIELYNAVSSGIPLGSDLYALTDAQAQEVFRRYNAGAPPDHAEQCLQYYKIFMQYNNQIPPVAAVPEENSNA
jgi:hypothetical protein